MPATSRSARAAIAFGAVAMSGCAIGERPALIEPATIRDPAAQQVLDLLQREDRGAFTASYQITPTVAGAAPVSATVIASGERVKVTVGNAVFSTVGALTRTCNLDGSACVEAADEARLSPLQISHLFWGPAMANRLELDSARSVAPSVAHSETLAGTPASCADVTVPAIDGAGVVVYCALGTGILARYVGADASIELTSFTASADETQLT